MDQVVESDCECPLQFLGSHWWEYRSGKSSMFPRSGYDIYRYEGIPTRGDDLHRDRHPSLSAYLLRFVYMDYSDQQVSQATIAVSASQELLADVFDRIENFFSRLEIYIKVRPNAGMTDIIVKIMIEVLSILVIATKEIKQSRTSELTRCGIYRLCQLTVV